MENGTPINPLKMESPSAEPLKKDNMDEFRAVMGAYKSSVDSIYAVKLYDGAMKAVSAAGKVS